MKKFKLSKLKLVHWILIAIFIMLFIYINYRIIDNFETSIRKEKVKYDWNNVKITDEQKNKYFPDEYHKKYKYDKLKPDTIFVSIASYRDPECTRTVSELFKKAFDWRNIYVGVCTQNKDSDKKCIDESLEKYKSNITELNLSYLEARGPQWARYMCSHLWNGEEYFLMIDSHLMFKDNWDIIIKNMYKNCPTNKAILTGYPPHHGVDGDNGNAFKDKDNFSYTCKSHFDHDNFHIISGATHISTQDRKEPWSTPYASAGFFFTNYKWLYEVPFDPYTPHLFQGEEILLAARSYTNGWDMFNLNQAICTHHYDRRQDNLPHFWDDHNDFYEIQKLSNMRYYHIMNQCSLEEVHPEFRKHIDHYGLGNKRSLQDYFDFSNMNLNEGKIESRCDSRYDYKTKQWVKI